MRYKIAIARLSILLRDLPAPPLNSSAGVLGGCQCVLLSVLASFAALLHQKCCRLLDTPAPIDRCHAPGEIGAADIGAGVAMVGRRVLDAALIARPFPRAGVCRRNSRT